MKIEKRHIKWIVLIIIILIMVVCTIIVENMRAVPSDKVSDYDMGKQRDISEKNVDDIYKKSDKEDDNSELVSYITEQSVDKYTKTAEKIFAMLEDEQIEDATKLLHSAAVSEKGYELNTGVLQEWRKNYGEKFEIMPYKYIHFDGYTYCMTRVANVVRDEKTGEKMADYTTSQEITFTIYKNGKFLPFALEFINGASGVHRKSFGEDLSTPDPELIKDLPPIAGIDDVDAISDTDR